MQPIATAPSRAQQVYNAIRDSICDGKMTPGTHLVQEELAAALGVSRQPVQQALLLLKNERLVVELGARGLYVAPLNANDVIHHYQIRIVLDQLAARLVTERTAASPAFALELARRGEAILSEGEAARNRSNASDAVSHDVQFHSFIYEMSGNPFIADTAAAHWNYLRRVMVAVLLHAERGEIVWRQHRDILDALLAGDAAASERLAAEHVLGAQDALLRTLAEREF
ncbi:MULTISPECIES: GntR family transcriptional regulator [unclassified Paracoccus (in: a-proteobacteria)]|uniref:GntR family transcriptional regulator n=1 Tax=unclassified Paracoccus (in: a-proteobacteria) TaxID=2688777 RepID=UPI001604840D|nr:MULTISPECIES: GntR family transcriptional regulator [unclassified Paracoccus (in: a-proteobacteria)]MBB1493000.1 GntR family transcriptional regulator [Paracoccus sp. MC1854]MBB1499546.1 GntR family transcriptional regulator [Paracoccus sp. MC1862]QQO45135.1 GntR family transcriptional regulator [Paracoccus sp. MC1862]